MFEDIMLVGVDKLCTDVVLPIYLNWTINYDVSA